MSIVLSSDYIDISNNNFTAYYGYEVVKCQVCGSSSTENDCCEDNEIWCFEFKSNDIHEIYSFNELGVNDMFDVASCLFAGIEKVFSEYKLVKK